MKRVLLPVVITACAAAMAYAAGPQAPVQLAQVQYKDAPQGTYKMDKGAGQGAYKMERGAGEFKGAAPQGQPQYQRPDKDYKDYKSQGGLYGQQKMDPAYGQQKMGPGGQPGGFGQDAFHK